MGDRASAHWLESVTVFGISPVWDMPPCSHTRDFGVVGSFGAVGKDWPLMRPIFFVWGFAQTARMRWFMLFSTTRSRRK